MRAAFVTEKMAHRERFLTPAQVDATVAEAEMPAYMESFLAHLRLLVGVPFDYLIPDSRLLPDESIRFFYLDRSWTDRLVDGTIAVGKIGTRDQAHHQAHAPAVQKQLDQTERGVRDLQRARIDFPTLRDTPKAFKAADVVTGFLLRSAAVSGWPHMDVRAYTKVLPRNFDPEAEKAHQLPTLRLERLSPSVLIALWEGVPRMVICEEPHHGIQFGVHENHGVFTVFRRDAEGMAIPNTADIPIPVRTSHPRVIAVAKLRRDVLKLDADHPSQNIPNQNGAASLAIELLSRPWRQRFQEQGGPLITVTGAFVPNLMVAPVITQAEIQQLIKGFVQ